MSMVGVRDFPNVPTSILLPTQYLKDTGLSPTLGTLYVLP